MLPLLLSAGVLFPCIHGTCDERTITFESSNTATHYTLYWKQGIALDWEPTIEVCVATCEHPCLESCQVYIHHPENPGDMVFFSLTATNEAGESEH